jgi:hypothetical protein
MPTATDIDNLACSIARRVISDVLDKEIPLCRKLSLQDEPGPIFASCSTGAVAFRMTNRESEATRYRETKRALLGEQLPLDRDDKI